MVLDIVKWNNDPSGILRKKNIDVKNNEHSKKLISDMFHTLKESNGVGLAAPQVGKNLNLFIVKYGDFEETFINPQIRPYGHSEQMVEGCLSVPGIDMIVTRRGRVEVRYFDRNWVEKYQEFEGVLARIIQHEYDHLIGKLIVDY